MVAAASNRVHGAKRYFHDGGAIYNLSASPGTLITENYIFDNSKMIGLYLDEGSRYIVVRRNVVQDPEGEWLNVNTVHSAYPLRISPDNTATGNWHDGSKVGGTVEQLSEQPDPRRPPGDRRQVAGRGGGGDEELRHRALGG